MFEPFYPVAMRNMPRTADVQAGAVPFDSLPVGAFFFFGGEYTVANQKTGRTTYLRPFTDRPVGLMTLETLVHPD